MRTFSLQSGSSGNAIYVEADGVKLLFDAGISGTMAQRRMVAHGRNIFDVDAVIISHDHVDHIRCAGIYHRKFGLPVFLTQRTHKATWCDLGKLTDAHYFQSGDTMTWGRVSVHTISTPHDAADGVVFVVECDGKRLAILTDLGHPTLEIQAVLKSVDAAYIEANYDRHMLAIGGYPRRLQDRIRGDGGHISNIECGSLLAACGRKRPKWIAVAHLSENNNEPELAVEAQHQAVGHDYPVHIAPRTGESEEFRV